VKETSWRVVNKSLGVITEGLLASPCGFDPSSIFKRLERWTTLADNKALRTRFYP